MARGESNRGAGKVKSNDSRVIAAAGGSAGGMDDPASSTGRHCLNCGREVAHSVRRKSTSISPVVRESIGGFLER